MSDVLLLGAIALGLLKVLGYVICGLPLLFFASAIMGYLMARCRKCGRQRKLHTRWICFGPFSTGKTIVFVCPCCDPLEEKLSAGGTGDIIE